LVEHLINTAHCIDFDGTSKLVMATTYMDHVVKEAIEIQLHPDNFNRNEGFNLSCAWCPLVKMLILSGGAPMGKKERQR